MAAIAHALCLKEYDEKRKTRIKKPKTIDKIAVLSIGTGQTTRRYTYKEVEKWGLAKWAQKIPDIFLDPSAENSEHISTRIFLGIEPKNYLRLNFKLEEVEKKSSSGENKEDIDIENLKIEEDKNTFKISQNIDIDNPDICKILSKASEVYLREGKVYYDKKENSDERREMDVKDAIDEFFDNVKKQDKKEEDEKHLTGL